MAMAESKSHPSNPISDKDVKAPNLIERAMEEIEAIMHKSKSPRHHHKETHGTSEDIDENTPISKVKGPNVFERVKEEIEAVVQTIHPKK
ncbi:Long chain acyl-CoA synthetase [Actinidia chinensis var. chinensis]|uniref:Long chain acyl-CoA synthetase n=1 Tax=Actinidia chinensis var. chinensis TaxID=1590841 RepID=A0A2R6QUT7_ACTCC|nr:Long chain acyl-CoA synthetase [Actinidia chinensis var. chinensis]